MNRNRIMVVVGIALLLAVLASVGGVQVSLRAKSGGGAGRLQTVGIVVRDVEIPPRLAINRTRWRFPVAERIVSEGRHRRSEGCCRAIALRTLPAGNRSWSRSWCP